MLALSGDRGVYGQTHSDHSITGQGEILVSWTDSIWEDTSTSYFGQRAQECSFQTIQVSIPISLSTISKLNKLKVHDHVFEITDITVLGVSPEFFTFEGVAY